MRRILKGTGNAVVLLLLVYGYQVWTNNKPAATTDQAQIEITLEKSIAWLDKNRDKLLLHDKPTLWLMVQQAAAITDDQRLKNLFTAYEQRYLKNRHNIWRPLFYPGSWAAVRFDNIASLPYYNWYFIYAYLCDKELGRIPEIAVQNTPSFCNRHPLLPTCVTHQLMGMRLLQRSECGDSEELGATIQQLQQRIRRQLVLDPRIVDVYMQRVLMLVESGAKEMVKPVWIKNLVEAQQDDGSWSPFEPLIPLMDGQYLGYEARLFSVGRPYPSFHTTAQGLLLFSLLSNREGI